jgi:tetratricopeptide (TPR) repeat protein
MPYADPGLQEKQPPLVAQLADLPAAEGLERQSRSAPSKAANAGPLAIDKPTMARINAALDKVAQEMYNATFDKCNSEQKAQTLLLTLQDGGTFSLTYNRMENEKPQTVTEFLKSGKGNCADFSRLLVAVAKEKGLPVQMVSVTFQAQNGSKEEEQHLAVFSMGDKTYYLDLSNQVMRSYSGFASTQDLVKDSKFQGDILLDYKRATKDGNEYIPAEEPRIMTGEKAYQATYWAEVGHYYLQKPAEKPEEKKQVLNEAINAFNKALSLELESHWVYAELGYAHFKKDEDANAIKYGEKALELRGAARVYLFVGDAHFHLKTSKHFEKAIDSFTQGLKIEKIPTMEFDLAMTHLNLGVNLGRSGDNTNAVKHFDEALRIFDALYHEVLTNGIPLAALGNYTSLAYQNKAVYVNNSGDLEGAIKIVDAGITELERKGVDTTDLKALRKTLKLP